MATAHPNAPALGGLKHRMKRLARPVEHTIDGITHTVQQTTTVPVPVLPRDWDRIVLRAATTAAAAMLVGSIVWSTASIAALLVLADAGTAASFAAAGVFDLGWVTCLAVEWLGRHDRFRARRARCAGHAALAIAMAAVGIHGWVAGSVAAGVIGAVVSAIAKTVWSVLIGHTSPELDELTAQWIAQQRAEAAAKLSLAAVRREIARTDQIAALITPAAPAPEVPASDSHANTTVRAAIQYAAQTMPHATPDALVDQLAHARITTTADTVRAVLGQQDTSSGQVLRLAHPPAESIADLVRRCLDDGVRDPDAVVATILTVRPDAAEATIRRTINRIA